MPFTPSHAVVALPFVRTPLVPAAIAVGAMAPDLPLFVRGLVPSYDTTHSPVWLPMTVLMALVLLLLWRCLLRPAAPSLVPRWVAERLPSSWDARPGAGLRETFATRDTPDRPSAWGVALVVLSLAIGVASHLVWDAFTHEGRWGVAIIPALDEEWGPLPGLKWVQHGSTVIGLVILAVWGARWIAGRRRRQVVSAIAPAMRWCWWATLPVLLVAAWTGGAASLGPLTTEFTPAHLAYRVLPGAVAIWAAITVVLAVVIVFLPRKDGRHARRSRSV